MMYFNIAGIIEKHNVGKIMLGRPDKQKDIQAKIQAFMKSLGYIIENREIEIQLVNEDYTSVQSGDIYQLLPTICDSKQISKKMPLKIPSVQWLFSRED